MTSSEVRAGFLADPASAAKARRLVDATLRSWRCDQLVDVATQLASELVANAVLHAGTTIQIVLRIDGGRLRVEVHDDNPRLPVRKRYSALSATGRGLLLVERLADSWGSELTESGKVVWFELDQPPASGPQRSGTFDFDTLEFDVGDLSPAQRRTRGEEDAGGSRLRFRGLALTPVLVAARR